MFSVIQGSQTNPRVMTDKHLSQAGVKLSGRNACHYTDTLDSDRQDQRWALEYIHSEYICIKQCAWWLDTVRYSISSSRWLQMPTTS